jgi:hypothetical protein
LNRFCFSITKTTNASYLIQISTLLLKNILLAAAILFALFSCKVSENITVDQGIKSSDRLVFDQVSKSDNLANKTTFKVIEQPDASKDIAQLNRIFEKKLIENGFYSEAENPELLVQSAISSVYFEKEILGYTDFVAGSPPKIKSGLFGKVIFLIQDAKTNEILWMGTGTGLLTANEILNSKEIKSALDQLIASLK